MRIKDDSVETDFTPQLLMGLTVCNEVYALHGCNLVITSGSEKVGHSIQSSHYTGNAADLRTRNLEADGVELEAVQAEIQERLNIHYQIILESDHFHIQYRPKH